VPIPYTYTVYGTYRYNRCGRNLESFLLSIPCTIYGIQYTMFMRSYVRFMCVVSDSCVWIVGIRYMCVWFQVYVCGSSTSVSCVEPPAVWLGCEVVHAVPEVLQRSTSIANMFCLARVETKTDNKEMPYLQLSGLGVKSCMLSQKLWNGSSLADLS
jgi:hypothetical protein